MTAAKVSYTVSRLAPAEVRADLSRLWQDNLTIEGGADRKFDWLYVEAPDPPDSVFLLAASGDGAASSWVGTAGVGIRRMWIAGQERRAGLLADLAVDRAHRTVAPALALVRAVKAWTLGALDLAYGFPNAHAAGVFKRVGYHSLGTINRWVRVLRHGGYADKLRGAALPGVPAVLRRVVDRAVEVPALAALGAGAFDVFRLAQIAPSAVQAARQVKLSWLPAADGRFDELWERVRGDYEVVGVRSSAFLRWRFPAAPNLRLAVVTGRDDDQLRAYAVIEEVDRVAHVRDLFGDRAAIGQLLDLLVPALYPRGVTSLSVRYLGAPALTDALDERGFVPRPPGRLISVGVGDRLDAEARAAVVDAERWHLTDADEDT